MGEERERSTTGFLVKQRAFLKLYMIILTEKEKGNLYGYQILDHLRSEFNGLGYRPQHSEIYKALHDLVHEGVLEQLKRKMAGADFQEVVYYRFKNKEKAELYKKQLKVELERCDNIIKKALKDGYGK